MIDILDDFFNFLQYSPSPWHATEQIAHRLIQHDYAALPEEERWSIKLGGKYFVQRGGALIAFTLPKKLPSRSIITASHTDSPCLKIKPHAEFRVHNMNLFRVESYGGPQLSTWFDRDLSLAGQVYVHDGKKIVQHLIYAEDHPMTIPSLAIHLQEKNDQGTPKQYIDKQEHLCPLIGLSEKKVDSLERILKSHIKYQSLLGFDLYLVPTQPPTVLGSSGEFIAAYRLDNLASAHASLVGLLEVEEAQEQVINISVFWNNEEIGSDSREGAGSPFLEETLKRICLALKMSEEDFLRLKNSSLCLSVDVAHGFHPNFPKRYDTEDHPLFGNGMIIKHHASMRYATTAHSTAAITHLCQKHQLPYQHSAGHSEVRGGSTVGPITSALMGITTVDIGPPLLSMHSTRELMATKDHLSLCKFLKLAFEKL
jgi:aspartyl aminopeptidase